MADTQTKSNAIEVKGLIKKFGRVTALDRLDLTVKTGQVHGFLGPNGAGKSTTIRVLLGLLKKNTGDVHLLGGDPWRDAVKLHRRLAYVPGDVDIWPNLSGGEAIDMLGSLRGGIDTARRDQLIRDFKLDPRKKCGAYSKGNRQKVAIVAALASDVELYILDEPTSGLDPLMQEVFNGYIVDLKKAGKTVLLSSHILAEVEQLCDTVTIIKDGQAVETGSLGDMRHLTHTNVVVDTEKSLAGFTAIKGMSDVKIDKNHAEFKVESAALDAVLCELTKYKVTALKSAPPSLEELFLGYYSADNAKAEDA